MEGRRQSSGWICWRWGAGVSELSSHLTKTSIWSEGGNRDRLLTRFNPTAGDSLRGRKSHYKRREVLHKPLHNAACYLSNGGLSCGLSAAALRPGAPSAPLGFFFFPASRQRYAEICQTWIKKKGPIKATEALWRQRGGDLMMYV